MVERYPHNALTYNHVMYMLLTSDAVLLLFVRYLYLMLKLKHDKNVQFTVTKPVFSIFCKIN